MKVSPHSNTQNISSNYTVFNFWEPLHFLQHGNGFQTWEVTPTFAIRSWAYILFHMPAARLSSVFALGKVMLANFTSGLD